MRLVERYLEEAEHFRNVRSLDRRPHYLFADPLYAVAGESTAAYTSDETARA